MKSNKKTRSEKIFIIIMSMLASFLVMLCLSSCNGSCMGCSFGCEKDENYNLGGISHVSEGCCSTSACQTAAGTIDTNDKKTNVSDIALMSCTRSSQGCCGNSSCYTACFVGKDVDCGDCGLTCGSTNGDNTNETTIGCIDGCVSCGGDEEMGVLYELIYYLLGI